MGRAPAAELPPLLDSLGFFKDEEKASGQARAGERPGELAYGRLELVMNSWKASLVMSCCSPGKCLLGRAGKQERALDRA